MATYTFTSNALQEAGLALEIGEINQGIDQQNLLIDQQNTAGALADPHYVPVPHIPHVVESDFVAGFLKTAFDKYPTKWQGKIFQMALQAFPVISPTNQATVLSTLGLSNLEGLPAQTIVEMISLAGPEILGRFENLTIDQKLTIATALGMAS